MEKAVETSDGRYWIRRFDPQYLPGVLSLWQTAFGKSMSMPLWQWKYFNGRFQNRILLGLDAADRVKAMYGGIAYGASWKGRQVEIVQLVDIMTHPDVRKTGLFPAMANTFFDWMCGPEKAVLLYGFPGKYHFDIGKKYLSYQALRGGAAFMTALTERLATRNDALPDYVMVRTETVDTAFDALWDQCASDYPFAVIRNAGFIDWRFLRHPIHSYDVWVYRHVSRPDACGYAVVSIVDGTARLLDMLMPFHAAMIGDFFSRIGAAYLHNNVHRIETWLAPDHFVAKTALSSGFEMENEPIGIIPTARLFHPALSFEWLYDHFYYTMADGDLF